MTKALNAALLLALLVTACTPVTPPTPHVLQHVRIQPQVAACTTVTWEFRVYRQGEDVTAQARYALIVTQPAPVDVPHFTLRAHPDFLTGYAAQAVDSSGEALDAPSFADAARQTFTCDRTGQTVTVNSVLVPGLGGTNAAFPVVTLSYQGDRLHAD